MNYGICFSLPSFGYIIHFDFIWIISEAQVRVEIDEMYINFIVLALILININEVGMSLLPLWLLLPLSRVLSPSTLPLRRSTSPAFWFPVPDVSIFAAYRFTGWTICSTQVCVVLYSYHIGCWVLTFCIAVVYPCYSACGGYKLH